MHVCSGIAEVVVLCQVNEEQLSFKMAIHRAILKYNSEVLRECTHTCPHTECELP